MRLLRCIVPMALVLLVLVAHSVTAGLSHDENKFVYAGQALAAHGRLPYLDYPYDQMPYAALFYGVAAAISPFDFLASRLLGALAWLACIIVLLDIARSARAGGAPPSIPLLLLVGDIVLVLVLLFDPLSAYVLGSAKNNSFATLFALLAFLFFTRAVTGQARPLRLAFWSGLFVALAACTRLNYAILFFVLIGLWSLVALRTDRRLWLRLLAACSAGAFAGSLPALALAALSPAHFLYANVVQLRLTTVYYQAIGTLTDVSLVSQLRMFQRNILQVWINVVLYLVLIVAGVVFLRNYLRRRSPLDLLGVAAVACALALLLTAFMARPMMDHYLFAPLPFLLIVLALAAQLLAHHPAWHAAMLALVFLALASRSSAADLRAAVGDLAHPATWPPLQVHQASQVLRTQYAIRADGPVLSLLPMLPAEAGYDAYGFTASGSNSWRTSPLLAAERRRLYGVVSPDELAALLDAASPSAILTGLEKPNPGFTFSDPGGLEVPFEDYARSHGYQPHALKTAFSGRALTLWLKP